MPVLPRAMANICHDLLGIQGRVGAVIPRIIGPPLRGIHKGHLKAKTSKPRLVWRAFVRCQRQGPSVRICFAAVLPHLQLPSVQGRIQVQHVRVEGLARQRDAQRLCLGSRGTRKHTLRVRQRLRHMHRRNLVGQEHADLFVLVGQGRVQGVARSAPLKRVPLVQYQGLVAQPSLRGALCRKQIPDLALEARFKGRRRNWFRHASCQRKCFPHQGAVEGVT